MREFKFRSWSDKRKEMIYYDGVFDLVFILSNKEAGYLNRYDSVTIMQFTGIKDKNGKEVYEGDVAKIVSFPMGILYHGVIKYQKEDMAFCPTFEKGNYFLTENLESKDGMPDIEVIGNIFENPEILKEKWGMSKEDIMEKLYTEEDSKQRGY